MFALLAIYTFFVFIRPQEYVSSLSNIPIMPLLLVILFISFIFTSEKKLFFPQDKFILLFLIAALLSQVLNGSFYGAKVFSAKFIPIVLLYYIITHTLTTHEKIEKYFMLIVVFGLIMALHGIFQFYNNGIGWTGQTFTPKTTRIRYIGIFSDPNDLSLVFLFSLPLLVYFLLKTNSFIFKVFATIAIGIFLYAIFLTQSRGAMLSLLGMIGYYGFRKYGLKKGLIAGLVIAIPLIIFASGRILDIDTGEESAHGRIDAWYEGIQFLISSPIWGIGTGMFTERYYLTAHNSFVLCFAETGILGYYFWFGLIFFSLFGLFNATKIEQQINENYNIFSTSFFLTISLIGFLIASFFLSRTYTIILYIILALITSYFYVLENENDVEIFSIDFSKYYVIIFIASIFSIIGMYIIVRVTI